MDVQRVAEYFGRLPSAIAWQAKELRFKMPPPWRTLIAPRSAVRRRPELLAFPYIITRRPEHETLLAVNSLIPPALPDWIRADICQTIMLEILEGNVTLDALNYATVSRFIRRTKRDNWDYQTISLDAPMRDGRSWHDVLADPTTSA